MPEKESARELHPRSLLQVDCELVQLLEHDREKRVDTVVDELVEVSLGLLVIEIRPELLVHLRERGTLPIWPPTTVLRRIANLCTFW